MDQALPEMFHFMVSSAIDAEGVYPYPAVVLDVAGEVSVMALDLRPPQVLRTIVRAACAVTTAELIFGMDRFTKAGQGTELDNLFAGAWYRKGLGWKVGIIEYRHQPRLVKEWNWDNPFWTLAVTTELSQAGAPDLTGGRS